MDLGLLNFYLYITGACGWLSAQFFWTAGTILEALLAMVVMPRLGWRWLLALSSIPSFVSVFLFIFTVESPRYLCSKGRLSEACHVLKRIAKANKTELPPGRLVSDQVTDLNEELLSPGKKKISHSQSGFSSLLMLLSPSLLRNTVLIWMVYIGNLLTSQFHNGQCRNSSMPLHINNDQSLYRDVLITSLAEIPGVLLSAIMVEKGGRKFTMAFLYVLDFLFLLPLLVPQPGALTTTFIFGAHIFFKANNVVAIIYCREIYPTPIRSTGFGVASSMGRIGALISPIIAVQLMGGCHQMTSIIFFKATLVLSAVSVLLFPQETKGRKLIDTLVA